MASSTDTTLNNLIINDVDSESTLDDMVSNSQIQPNQLYMTPDETADVIGMPIGTIFPSAIPQTSSAFHLLDGSTIAKTGIYADFATLVQSLVTAGYNISCTQAQFDSDVSTYGQCGKFVIGTDTIRLPLITQFIAGLSNITGIGTAELDTFKSHNHGVNDPGHSHKLSTAVTNNGWNGVDYSTKADNYGSRSTWSATTGITIQNRGDAETKPKNVRYPYYIVVANSYKTDIQVDIDQVASDINNATSKIAKGIISFPDPTRYIDVTSSCQSLANSLTTFYTPNFNGWLVFQTSSSDKTSSYQNCFQNTTMGIRIQTDFYHYASNAGGMIPFRAGDVLQYLKETNSTVNSVKLYYLVGDR